MNDVIDQEKRKTVLIIGINSFLGSNMAEFLKKDFRVVGTTFHRHIAQPGILTLPCNVINKDEVQLVIYAFKPDIILYCAGLPTLTSCHESPQLSDAMNSGGLYNVADLAPRYGARVVYFSSHYVFSGEDKNYNEMDNPDVNTHYGKALATSEFYLQKSSLNYIIIRCANFYGRGINPLRATFFETLQKNIFENKKEIYDDYYKYGFLDIYFLSMVLKMCIDKNITNRLLHFSSQDTMTHYEFAQTYCKVFSESESTISKGKWHFPVMKGTEKKEIAHYKLDVLNFEGLMKIKMPTIEESLLFTLARLYGEKKKDKSDIKKGTGVTFI